VIGTFEIAINSTGPDASASRCGARSAGARLPAAIRRLVNHVLRPAQLSLTMKLDDNGRRLLKFHDGFVGLPPSAATAHDVRH
jgi:hypothetical protein